MSRPDDWDDPSLGRRPPGPSFWSTVRWRWRFGLVVTVLASVIIFVISLDYYPFIDAAKVGAAILVAVPVLWFGSRVLYAWLEWPSEWQPVRWLKAMLRLLLFDTEAERRAAGALGAKGAEADGGPRAL